MPVLRAAVPHELQQAGAREEVPGQARPRPAAAAHRAARAGRHPGQPQRGAQRGLQVVGAPPQTPRNNQLLFTLPISLHNFN